MSARIIVADVLEGLAQLEPESAQCVVTSPPYWGLRDYGVPGQLGLEPTPRDYLKAMVGVFREVRRVLKRDGTLWLNMGDCYTPVNRGEQAKPRRDYPAGMQAAHMHADLPTRHEVIQALKGARLKPKDLVGMPWRLAFALQRRGWWLRSDIVWSKPNPMPESVTDRPTKSHEYLFLMARSARYYYDAAAIAEPAMSGQPLQEPAGWARGPGSHDAVSHNTGSNAERRERSLGLKGEATPDDVRSSAGARFGRGAGWRAKNADQPAQNGHRRLIENTAEARANGADHDSPFGTTRNRRTVWEIATQAFPDAHFATFPEELVEPCILAGSKRGDTVLDPFAGSGTVGLVADYLGRDFIGIELNPAYAAIAERRLREDSPLFASVDVVTLTQGDR